MAASSDPSANAAQPRALDHIWLTYPDDICNAAADAHSAIRFAEEQIAYYERVSAERAEQMAKNCFGYAATVADAVERHKQEIEAARDRLAEIESDPAAREFDLIEAIGSKGSNDDDAYTAARARFADRYGGRNAYTSWVIGRETFLAERQIGAVGASFKEDEEAVAELGKPRRLGWHKEVVSLSSTDPRLQQSVGADRYGFDFDALVDFHLSKAKRMALMMRFYERAGHECLRTHWSRRLSVELSVLTETTGFDYEFVERGPLPSRETVARWEAEIATIDREDHAIVCETEAIAAYRDGDQEWAAHREELAEESRQRAAELRRDLFSATQRRPGCRHLLAHISVLHRGPRARAAHGLRMRRRRAIARAASRGGDSGDPDPGPAKPPPASSAGGGGTRVTLQRLAGSDPIRTRPGVGA